MATSPIKIYATAMFLGLAALFPLRAHSQENQAVSTVCAINRQSADYKYCRDNVSDQPLVCLLELARTGKLPAAACGNFLKSSNPACRNVVAPCQYPQNYASTDWPNLVGRVLPPAGDGYNSTLTVRGDIACPGPHRVTALNVRVGNAGFLSLQLVEGIDIQCTNGKWYSTGGTRNANGKIVTSFACDSGMLLSGMTTVHGLYVDRIQPVCRKIAPASGDNENEAGPAIGGSGGDIVRDSYCTNSEHEYVKGIRFWVRSDDDGAKRYMRAFSLICA